MFRRLTTALSVLFVATASAALAGTAYVPLPGVTTVGSVTYKAQVTISNFATAGRTVKSVQLPTNTDGTVRTGITPTQTSILAEKTVVLEPTAAFRGLLELSDGTEVNYDARLISTGAVGKLGVYLPVITSANLFAGGKTQSLQGLTHAATRTTDMTIVGTSQLATSCTISLVRADGTQIAGTTTIQMKPLSSRYFVNIFNGLVDANGVADARAEVSCTVPFYAFALLADSSTGELSVIDPAGSGESTLAVPGETASCASGAVCFDAKGIVHQPTPGKPVGRVQFPLPAGTYTHLKLQMEVTIANWYPQDPSGKHLIYWWVVDRNFNMPGMLFFRGPDAYTALSRHGWGLTHPQKLTIQGGFHGEIGHTYRIVDDYDMKTGRLSITVTDLADNQVKQTLNGAPNIPSVTLAPGHKFIVDMGFKEGATPDEVPSFNWVYQNLHLEAIP